MRTILGAVGLGALVAGCAADPVEAPVSRTDLRQAMAAPAVDPVGVAITPNGDRFVFDSTLGLYQIVGDSAVAAVPMSALPDGGPKLQLPFTDITAIGPGLFALTAIGDGFVLDTSAMTLQQRFCYVPDGTPANLTQRTDAIAYDAELDRLYAQPVTFNELGVRVWSQLASYTRATGASVAWNALEDSVTATGMTLIPGTGLVVGQGSRLERLDLSADLARTIQLDTLERFGIQSIDGLAVDTAAGTLLIVDGTTDELVEIELSRLSL